MEKVIVNGVNCICRHIDNTNLYTILLNNPVVGVPRVVKVEDFKVYYQYIEGCNLREYMAENGILSKNQLKNLFIGLIRILGSLKELNIVHKDIKPENIIISSSEHIFLTDFDISRIENNNSYDTLLFGTRGYASPEHFGYSTTTFKSDMFSLGKVIEELDVNNYFTSAVSICTQIDPKHRFDDYDELIDCIINEKQFKNRKKNVFRTYFNNSTIVIYSTIFILFSILINADVDSFVQAILNLIIVLVLVDILDYIHALVMFRKYLLLKPGITFIIVILYAAIQKLFM